MFFGISHVVMHTTDLEATAHLWCQVMGFTAQQRSEDHVDIDTGSAVLRLVRVPRIESPVSLRVTVSDVEKAYQALLSAGAHSRYAPMKTPELEEMACVTDANGHSVVLWRALTEDEWGFTPELPKEGVWPAESEELLKRLLGHVPALFRMLARRKTTRVIEMMAREAKSPITRELVIKGYITSSAKVTRSRLIEPLRAEGINPEDYQAAFDYE